MKNNFVPCFSFHKKEVESTTKGQPFFLARQAQSSLENTQKNIVGQGQHICPEGQVGVSTKQILSTQEESMKTVSSDQLSSCTSSEITTKPRTEIRLGRDQRAGSPMRPDGFSPRPTFSPARQGPLMGNHAFVARTTLKHMMQPKSKQEEDRSAASRQNKLTVSVRSNKAIGNSFQSPLKSIQKQNLILREENELLRKELIEIKKELLTASLSKKDDTISNLRSTIKREDGEIKDLRVKLQLSTKKNSALSTLIQNKDDQILFLSGKLAEVQKELAQLKERNADRLQKLKERINLVLKNYGELEGKWSKAEMEWLSFKQKWMEEKGIYLHRITFLEQYIAHN